ncbi:hypothetical protein [Nocardia vermiculata]|uniref:hypothetical protein n=1 Tax=Nocardia vermiculata TaxID=257274 RepID=UPI001FE1108E|nr:hypothetical protein [Nocardia vermiculata]
MTTRRNRRSGVEDLWHKTVRKTDGTTEKVHSQLYGKGKRWRVRYVDDAGKERTQRFERKVDAQTWLGGQTSTLMQGTHVAPRDAKMTVQQWCDEWVKGYAVHCDSAVRQARRHIAQITAEFGHVQLSAVRPSAVKVWTAKLKQRGNEASYIYALHSRLSQILGDAVLDGVLARAIHAPGAPHHRQGSRKCIAPPRSRCGRSTTRCPNTSVRPCCSERSPACASPKCPA